MLGPHSQTGSVAGCDVTAHLDSLRRALEDASRFAPRLVNCHAGADSWEWRDIVRFSDGALEGASRMGIPVVFEAHRGRALYSPWSTRRGLDQFNELRLCCDFSHWVVVGERLLDDRALISACADRGSHVDARAATKEGTAGIPIRRRHESKGYLQTCESWWWEIWRCQQRRGDHACVVTSEYGSTPYLPPFRMRVHRSRILTKSCDGRRNALRTSLRNGRRGGAKACG